MGKGSTACPARQDWTIDSLTCAAARAMGASEGNARPFPADPEFARRLQDSLDAVQRDLLGSLTRELTEIRLAYEKAVPFLAEALRDYRTLANELAALGPGLELRESGSPLETRHRRLVERRREARTAIGGPIAVVTGLERDWNTCWKRHLAGAAGALAKAVTLISCYAEGLPDGTRWTPPELRLDERWLRDPGQERARALPPELTRQGEELAHAWLAFWRREYPPLSLESADDGYFEID
ncbi:hypothetical protein [Acrocarpospora catenulata]|uniref:hypothetical protein n=1 Tax=Acrocarpospora catenulata TaxID=2836182 RepID=UPI001BD9CE6A|nr:hypothetical protein [Acrocarpospora catenulata]